MVASGRAWVVGGKGAVLATGDLQSDATPPTTTDDAPAGWVDHDVTVTLSATDAGSGVARTEYRLDGSVWTSGTHVTVKAPADHSGDGVHTIDYRSVDAAGNDETDRTCAVRIDTRAPYVVASSLVFARYGRPAILACTALDPNPNGGSVTVMANGIRTNRRHPWSATATTAPGGVATLALPDGLPRGAYRVVLAAHDVAGNAAVAPVVVLLVVR
jgi:hypothetical protein